mgnify:CR=1 FL=1
MKKMRILIPLVLVAAAAAGWLYFARSENATPVTTAAVTRATVEETVLASGTMEAKQLVSVGARVSGQIETLAVALGDEVQKGDLIAQIDSQDQQNAVLTAKANLANIKAEHVLERQIKLMTSDYVSTADLESAQADVDVYKAELDALAAQKASVEVTVSTAQIALERTRITAPISGTIVAIVNDEGQTVNATQSAPTIVKIAELDEMVVKAEISEADVVHRDQRHDLDRRSHLLQWLAGSGQSRPSAAHRHDRRSLDHSRQGRECADRAILGAFQGAAGLHGEALRSGQRRHQRSGGRGRAEQQGQGRNQIRAERR